MTLTERDIKFIIDIYKCNGICYDYIDSYKDCGECIIKRTMQLDNANYNTVCTDKRALDIAKRYIEIYPEIFMEHLL